MQHNIDFLKLVEECRPFVKEISVNEVKAKVDKAEHFSLLDVREDHEWTQGRIPTAIHMARGLIERDIEQSIPDKTTPIVLYCAGGFRSVLAAYNLQKMGYTNVASMADGIRSWINLGYPLSI